MFFDPVSIVLTLPAQLLLNDHLVFGAAEVPATYLAWETPGELVALTVDRVVQSPTRLSLRPDGWSFGVPRARGKALTAQLSFDPRVLNSALQKKDPAVEDRWLYTALLHGGEVEIVTRPQRADGGEDERFLSLFVRLRYHIVETEQPRDGQGA